MHPHGLFEDSEVPGKAVEKEYKHSNNQLHCHRHRHRRNTPPSTTMQGRSNQSPANSPVGKRVSRVPAALQNIFLQSQAGGDVNKIAPPANKLGFRVFRRNNNNNNATNRASKKAPDVNSLYAERNGTKDTAATASRKAMKGRVAETTIQVVGPYSLFGGGGGGRVAFSLSSFSSFWLYFLLEVVHNGCRGRLFIPLLTLK
jgi:hypothetical protein